MTLLLAVLLAVSTPPLEQLAERLLPAEKFDQMAGFFGPVVKRYQPVFDKFVAEYESTPDKMAIVAKYLPEAEKALAAARRMKIPAKYEKEKAEYIRLLQTLLVSAKLAVKLSGAKPPPAKPPPNVRDNAGVLIDAKSGASSRSKDSGTKRERRRL